MKPPYPAWSRKLLNPLWRLAWRSRLAIEMWASSDENPFLIRDRRLDARRNKPLRTLLTVATLILCFSVVCWSLRDPALTWLRAQGPDAVVWEMTLRALSVSPIVLAAYMGCAVCGYAIFWVCQSRAATLLRAESLQHTLEQLQLLPLAEERWLWLMSAQPAGVGMLIGALGLPFYLLAVRAGAWTLSDVIGLCLVFGWLANIVPSPMPTRTARKGAQMARPSQAQVGAAQPVSPAVATSDERAIEAVTASWQQFRTEVATSFETASNETASDEHATAASAARLSIFDPAWLIIGLLLRQGIVEMFHLVQIAPSAGSGDVFWSHVFWSLPDGIRVLLPALPLTWPLLLGRCLMTPLPYFTAALSPILLLLPFWLGVRVNRYSHLAARISVINRFWQQRRARRREATKRLLWWCAGLMAVGYGWQPLILEGRLGATLEAPHTLAWALAAAWTVALVLGTTVAAQSITKALTNSDSSASLPSAWRRARRSLSRGLGGAVVLYFLSCWMGGCEGVNDPWLARLGPTMGTAGAFLLALYGSLAVQWVLPEDLRQPARWLHYLWFYGLPGEAFARIFYEWCHFDKDGIIQKFSFEQAPHLVLSPTVSLLALFRADLSRPGVPWWSGPLFQVAVGGLCLLWSWRVTRAQTASSALSSQPSWWSRFEMALDELWRRTLRALLAVALWLWKCFSPSLLRFLATLTTLVEAWAQNLMRWVEPLDNPLITLQFRRGARVWVGAWLTLAGAGALAIVLWGRPWELFYHPWQATDVAVVFAHLPQNSDWQDWGITVVLCSLAAAGVAVTLAVIGLGQAFDAERHAGTLVFLFLTALTDDELLVGKLLPRLVFGAGIIVAALPTLIIGCLVGGLGGDWSWCAISVCGLLAIASTLVFVACWHLLFAVRATKPLEGLFTGLASVAPIEAIGWILVVAGANASGLYLGVALLAVAVAHMALSIGSWRLAVAALRRQRYGDLALTGYVRHN